MQPLKYYCVGGFVNTGKWLRGSAVYTMDKADVVVFPGGPDVNPALYGEKEHPKTHIDLSLDAKEISEFNDARRMGKKIIGICRGAQLMCALAGGKLVQDQQNFGGTHPILTYDGKIIKVSSSHHQAMFPWGMAKDDFRVLGWSFEESDHHVDASGKEIVIGDAPLDMEVEVAFFPKIKALCIQGHPEWQFPQISVNKEDRTAIEYFQDLVDRFMAGNQFTDAHASFTTND